MIKKLLFSSSNLTHNDRLKLLNIGDTLNFCHRGILYDKKEEKNFENFYSFYLHNDKVISLSINSKNTEFKIPDISDVKIPESKNNELIIILHLSSGIKEIHFLNVKEQIYFNKENSLDPQLCINYPDIDTFIFSTNRTRPKIQAIIKEIEDEKLDKK
jgi:hypothetical protein